MIGAGITAITDALLGFVGGFTDGCMIGLALPTCPFGPFGVGIVDACLGSIVGVMVGGLVGFAKAAEILVAYLMAIP